MAKSDLTLLDIGSEALLKDLSTALATPVEVLRSLAENLDTDRGFHIRDETRAFKSWTAAALAPAALSDTCAVLRELFNHGVKTEKTPGQLLDEIEELCSAKDIPGFNERREVLRALLTPSDRHLERRAVVPSTQSGFPILVGLDTSVELRAAYRSARSDELLGLVPMAILRIATKYDNDENAQVRRFAMQLTEEDIDRLIDRLQLSKRRLFALRRHVRESDVKVYEDLIRGQWKADTDE